MTVCLNWNAFGLVVVVALTTSVGMVVLFALGVRALSHYVDARQAGTTSVASLTAAVLSFVLSAAVAAFGIYVIVAG